MRTGRFKLIFLAIGLCGTTGCVDRRFVVETNVPGAQVYVDGVPIGPSPADGSWEYAGRREIIAVAPGYESRVERVRFKAKWYEYPGLDFFAEVVWPFRIEDVRRVKLDLEPTRSVNQVELISNADSLRARAASLPPTSVPPSSGKAGSPKSRPVGPGPSPVPDNYLPAFGPTGVDSAPGR